MKLSELLAYLDSQEELTVLQAVSSLYEDAGSRGLFCDKFIPFADLATLGYQGVRQFITSMYEIDEHFLLANKGELLNLKSKIQNLKGIYPDGY